MALAAHFLGPDPVEEQLEIVLNAITSGRTPSEIEHRLVDCKEEPGRRDRHGVVLPGNRESDDAAKFLAREAACFANSESGGALILGVADDGQVIGTVLDAEWLRRRIYELTDRRLTVEVRAAEVRGSRVLILRIPEALEPVAYRNRITWRVGDSCVEVDTASWWSGRLHRLGHDWSAQPSGHRASVARAAAVELAREFLRTARDPAAAGLAAETDLALLTRLNAVTADGMLTNAGALLLVGRTEPAIDYIRRDAPGGDSRRRLRVAGRGALEELAAAEDAIAAYNPTIHVRSGLVQARIEAIPPAVAREALVNAVAHRDWSTNEPITIEHVGNTLIVSSPGGFIGGVTADNIITHPSQARNRALAEMLTKFGVAEREGIGVDRMVRDMIRYGHPAPAIVEVAGPRVRAALVGSEPDDDWLGFLHRLDPVSAGEDLDLLLIVNRLIATGWVDAAAAAPVIQKSETEATAAFDRLVAVRSGRAPVVTPVKVPSGSTAAYRLSDGVRVELKSRLSAWLPAASRADLALSWARHRGRVSSTEVADIVGTTASRAGPILRGLEESGQLEPGRATRTGRGFYYVPV